MGHFARECRKPRKTDNRSTWYKKDKNKEPTTEEPKVLLAIDGVSFDWSFMTQDEGDDSESAMLATEHALMAFSDTEVHIDNACSKTCKALKEYENLKTQYDAQMLELHHTNYNLANHKRGLGVVETQLEHYRANESKFNDDIAVLKRDLDFQVAVNIALREEIEKVKKASEKIQITNQTLDHQSKSINKIWEAQVVNKAKSGVGYKTVPPPLRGVPAPPGIDLAHTGLEEFQEPTMTYGPKFVKEAILEKVQVEVETFDSASDSSLKDECLNVESKSSVPEKAKVEVRKSIPDVVKEKPRTQSNFTRPTIRYAEMYRDRSTSPRGNMRSWNHVKTRQFGSDFVFNNKACHICGSFDHLSYTCNYHMGRREVFGNTRVNGHNSNKITHPNPLSNMVPRSVLLTTGIKPISTARPAVATASSKNRIYPKSHVTTFVKSSKTGIKTHFEKNVHKNHMWRPKVSNPAVSTSRPAVTTTRPNVSTGVYVNKKRVNMGNAVKASARWEWKPKGTTTSNTPNGVSMTFDRYNYIDTRGRSKSFVAWVPKRN
jgi:hypothetical protein